ncbi:MAG: alkaline phosphatase family protein [Desulfurococcales archaeon]|nr:alkaline phosphatase family protein [Desulfurococcales archaeon]MEB3789021.1 alkaline phosphatase family protein [Desulfurococcales archaeon]
MDAIAVLGLDALPYRYLKIYAEKGIAPNIFKLQNIHASYRIRAIPPITPASWPSIMSGVNPGKHGIFSFSGFDKKTKKVFYYNASHLMHPRITEMIAYEGGTVLSVNPIMDYPIFPHKNLTIVSNMFFTPKPLSYPKNLIDKYFSTEVPLPKNKTQYIKYLDGLEALLEDYLQNPPKLIWINLNFPDALYHAIPETLNNPEKVSQIWRRIDKIYLMLKEIIGNVIIVSDHGFSRHEIRISINDILIKHNLAASKSAREEYLTHKDPNEFRIVKINPRVMRFLMKTGLKDRFISPVVRRVVKPLYEKLTKKKLMFGSSYYIDVHNSDVIYPTLNSFGVYVLNSDKLEQALSVLKQYEGLSIVEYKGKIFNGRYLDRIPDIVIIPDYDKGYVLGPPDIVGSVYNKTITYDHDLWGSMILDLSDTDSINLEYLNSLDYLENMMVGPIVQCMLGYPLSIDVDSKSLIEKSCNRDLSYKNYRGKFLVSKKLAVRKT